jgi:hypothetical protein
MLSGRILLIMPDFLNLYFSRPSTKTIAEVRDGKMTMIMSKLFVNSNKYRHDVFGLTRSMFANHLEMIVERGFPLLRRINEILSALRDMGMMDKLFVDFKYNMTILVPIREKISNEAVTTMTFDDENGIEDENPEIVLTTEHLEGAFSLLFAGLITSSTVFLLEIVFYSNTFKRTMKWIWAKITCKQGKPKEQKKNKKVGFRKHVEELEMKTHKRVRKPMK